MNRKNSLNRFCKNKKGIEVWISWVLITAFMIVLGVIVYRWSTSYATSSASDVETRAGKAECDAVALQITAACQLDNVIYVDIANRKDLKIDKVIFGLYDIFGNGESREKIFTLDVGKTINVEVLKQGTISTISAIPAIYKSSKWIVCPEKEVQYSNVTYC